MKSKPSPKLRRRFLDWYEESRRDLPWRKGRDPYSIWISEVMLQQTTSQAVVGFYARFLDRFPRVGDLAEASMEEVYEQWAGLGYYSRARNLHRAAQQLHANGFPQSHVQLLDLPGFGPYTSRSVASLAFDEAVGVVDGNVIRVLSRFYALGEAWWTVAGRQQFQNLADQWVEGVASSQMNQAMMELGATVCRPLSPNCPSCPLRTECVAYAEDRVTAYPLVREKRANEILIWRVNVKEDRNKLGLVKNDYAPFLKGQSIFPGLVERVQTRPKDFIVSHSITHYQIYVQFSASIDDQDLSIDWVALENVPRVNPSSLIAKVLKAWFKNKNEKSAHQLELR